MNEGYGLLDKKRDRGLLSAIYRACYSETREDAGLAGLCVAVRAPSGPVFCVRELAAQDNAVTTI